MNKNTLFVNVLVFLFLTCTVFPTLTFDNVNKLERTTVGFCCTTTEDGLLKLSSLGCDAPTLSSPAKNHSATWQLFVNDLHSGFKQQIVGFGAAFTDAAVAAFNWLPQSAQEDLTRELFSLSGNKSIGINLVRHTIGQSDLTPQNLGKWSYDESDTPDVNVSKFNLTTPGYAMIKWLKRMRDINPSTKLLGSIWSPPSWMKQNNNIQWKYVNSWIEYITKYLSAFESGGVHVDFITMQNEPLHSGDEAWTTFMDSSYQVILANKLETLTNDAHVELWAYDHNTDHPEYPARVVENSNVSNVAWHCYYGDGHWEVMSQFHENYPHVSQYMTECWLHLDSGEGFFDLPDFFGGPLRNWARGVMAWTIGGSVQYDVAFHDGCAQCSGIIQVNQSSGTYLKTQDYYTLGQFSRFVRRGAFVLNVTGGEYIYPDGTGVQANVFINPSGDRVVIIHNKIRNVLDLEVNFHQDAWIGKVPARSITTWVLPSHA